VSANYPKGSCNIVLVSQSVSQLFNWFFFFFFLGPVCISSGSTSAFKAYCAIFSWLLSCIKSVYMCLEKDTNFNRIHSVALQEPGKYPRGSARLRGCHLLACQRTVCSNQSTTDFPLMHLVCVVYSNCVLLEPV
jgi:hypothetical protein